MAVNFEIGDAVIYVNNSDKGAQIDTGNMSLPLFEGAEYIIADTMISECCNSVKLDVGILRDDVTEQQCKCGHVYKSGPRIWVSAYRFVKPQ